MPRTPQPLHLPRPSGSGAGKGPILRRSRVRRRRHQRRWFLAGKGLLLGGLGITILVGLVRIPDRLDALLLVSQAIANLIAGLNRLAVGLLQLGAVLLVVLMALLALLLLTGGLVRLWRALLPAVTTPLPRDSGSAPLPPLL
jgi:hypothetical protein